jgi:hypothetical protein
MYGVVARFCGVVNHLAFSIPEIATFYFSLMRSFNSEAKSVYCRTIRFNCKFTWLPCNTWRKNTDITNMIKNPPDMLNLRALLGVAVKKA